MPAFGKVHSALHTGVDRVKSGLKWAGHKYQQGMHLAGRANDLYQTGKKIAGIFMPELQRMGLDQGMLKGFGAMDHMRDSAISRHQDVLDKIGENSAIVGKMRQSHASTLLFVKIKYVRGYVGCHHQCSFVIDRLDKSH